MRVTWCAPDSVVDEVDRHRPWLVGNHPGRQFRMSAMSKRVSLDGANKSSKELVAEFRHDFAIGRIGLKTYRKVYRYPLTSMRFCSQARRDGWSRAGWAQPSMMSTSCSQHFAASRPTFPWWVRFRCLRCPWVSRGRSRSRASLCGDDGTAPGGFASAGAVDPASR